MSGKGPTDQSHSQSKYTKPLEKRYDETRVDEHNTDNHFKKTIQVVGKPQTLERNVMDDYIKNPPINREGSTPPDYVVQGAGEISTEPNTVEAKSVEEIQARLDRLAKAQAEAQSQSQGQQ